MLHNDVRVLVGSVKLVTGENSREEVAGLYLRKLRDFAQEIHKDSKVEYDMTPVEEGVVLSFVVTLGEKTLLRVVTGQLPTTDVAENLLLCTDNQSDTVLGFMQQNGQWVTADIENKLSVAELLLAVYTVESENTINRVLTSRVMATLSEVLQLENSDEYTDILEGLNSI